MNMCHFFLIWPILQARGEIDTIFSLVFLEELKQWKIAFEIFWPLTIPDIRVNPEPTDPSNPKDIGAILATEVAKGPNIWGAHYK